MSGKNRVPETFSGTVLVSLKYDLEKFHLHQDYQQSKETTPDFRYFVERILPVIAPSQNKFKDRKGKKTLSEIFTVTDKAFGLGMLLNELHCWDEAAEKVPGERYAKKKFCDARSGNKKGWSDKGLKVYNRICKNLRSRRCEEQSI